MPTLKRVKASLKRRINKHLKTLGYIKTPDGTLGLPMINKSVVRNLHAIQRTQKLAENTSFIEENLPRLLKYFASGHEVIPERIRPAIQRVYSNSWESDLFRLASLSWSVPVSSGFGRRIRYLVWDQSNGKLMGLIAVGDPVFNLTVRDKYIDWNVKDRGRRLVNVLDAYVLGSVPPYNQLLCGKLIACLLRTRELYGDFRNEYGRTTGIISRKKKQARLLAITTTSSMGRSSVYNRLKLGGIEYLKSIGYTRGWGHFHIPESIFTEIRDFLRKINHPYADLHKFGQGPNWKLRTTRAALDELGYEMDLLKHGVGREVFIAELAKNSLKILKTGKGKPEISSLLDVDEVSELALNRWVIPRSLSRLDYTVWNNQNIESLVLNSYPMNPSEAFTTEYGVHK